MPKILFRADAEKSIGTGDLTSLIHLSDKFRKNSWKCFFATRDYELAPKIIKQYSLDNVYLISRDIPLKNEINLIKKICKDNTIDCLFMEVTENSLHDYETLGKPAPIKACVNFDGIISDDFDVVVNWCVDSSSDLYEIYKGWEIQFILGFENTVLPSYLDKKLIREKMSRKVAKRILISMGGVDEFNMTDKIIRVLAEKIYQYEVRVVIGTGYEYQKRLSRFISANSSNIILRQNVGSLFGDYQWADIAFSAGGLTSSELVAAKIPSILIATYKHQIKRCEYYSKSKWAYYAGYHKEINEEKIIKSLNHVLDNLNLFRSSLYKSDFRGGNEKIYEAVNSCRQSRQLV